MTINIDPLLKKISAVYSNIDKKLLMGLCNVQSKMYQDMDHIPPKIPVEYGNLRRSFYAVTSECEVRRGKTPSFTNDRRNATILNTDHSDAIARGLNRAIKFGTKKGPCVVFGFSAFYALYVHEKYGGNIKWTRPESGPGFFQAAIRNNINDALKIMARTVRMPK